LYNLNKNSYFGTMQFIDQLQQIINLEKTPQRIISLVPSQTELLVDLGLKKYLVGITKFCVHPEELREEIDIVGGTKDIHLDKIKQLKPDLILCNKEENTKEIVTSLQHIAPVHVSNIHNIEESLVLIKQYGEIFSIEKNAASLIEDIKEEYNSFTKFIENKPNRKIAYFIWRKPWMVAGGNTFINELLQLNHFKNIFEATPRYPEVDLKDLKEVDLVLLSSEPFPFKEKHIQELTAYVSKDKIKLVDGEYFSWYGSRLKNAFTYFKQLHYSIT